MTFQERVANTHVALFHDDPTDVAERRDRYGEESLEVLQAFDMTPEQAHALVDYVFKRPKGEPKKEIGAASLTLTSLCVVAGYDRSECEEADLETLVQPETIARIRAKRSTRHGRGPLPGFDPAPRAAPAPQSIASGSNVVEAARSFMELFVAESGDDRYLTVEGIDANEMAIRFADLQSALASGTSGSMRDALQQIIDMNVQYAQDRYGDAAQAETMSCVQVARAALAANHSPVSVAAGTMTIEEYVDGYCWRGDAGDYTPNEQEKALLIDALHGAAEVLFDRTAILVTDSMVEAALKSLHGDDFYDFWAENSDFAVEKRQSILEAIRAALSIENVAGINPSHSQGASLGPILTSNHQLESREGAHMGPDPVLGAEAMAGAYDAGKTAAPSWRNAYPIEQWPGGYIPEDITQAALECWSTMPKENAGIYHIEKALLAVREKCFDKIEGLSADLDSAVEVAFRRGAVDWVRRNYPAHFERLSATAKEGK